MISLLGFIFAGLDYASSHASFGEISEKNSIAITANDTLTVKMKNDDSIFYRSNLRRSTHKEEVEIAGKKRISTRNEKNEY